VGRYGFAAGCFIVVLLLCRPSFSGQTPEGTAWVSSHGYDGCIELFNETTRVVLEPNCGGRVLVYETGGRNVLYIDPAQDGWVYEPGKKRVDICAGRFDIGPEKTGPPREALWLGRWNAEITGPRSARMTSVEDESSGVQLIRDFRLDAASSRLRCTQTIRNVSGEVKRYFHWSRTFAEGGGICVVPITPGSRFPEGYIYYEPKRSPRYMNFRPERHPGTRVRDGFLEISEAPPFPKFGLDSEAGWLAYITKSDLLFVKRFPVYPERVYGEMASLTVSIWYVENRCELEPIGPRETLGPGESASFTETWWLFDYPCPRAGEDVDLVKLEKFVEEHTR